MPHFDFQGMVEIKLKLPALIAFIFCIGFMRIGYTDEPIGEIHATGFTEEQINAALAPCELRHVEKILARLMLGSSAQKRFRLRCNPQLNKFAAWRARDMAERNYFDHVTPENKGANDMLRESGYTLPRYYSHGRGNNVEAIVGGVRDPEKAWLRLLESTAHREHVLGTHEVYREQSEFGVAYHFAEKTAYVDYWVIVIARPYDAADPNLVCTPPPSSCFDFTVEEKPGDDE